MRARVSLLDRTVSLIVIAACAASAFVQDAYGAACQRKRSKVVGGETAFIDNWPGQAVLRLQSDTGTIALYFCGGTVIGERWVLTAAHCVPEFLQGVTGTVTGSDFVQHPAHLEIVAGVEDLTSVEAADAIPVEQVIMHENFRPAAEAAVQIGDAAKRADALDRIAEDRGDDIALLKLARPWTGPVSKLDASASGDAVRGQVRVAGFGTTETNRYGTLKAMRSRDGKGELFAGSPRLLETSILAIPRESCKAAYPKAAIGDGQLCAGLDQGGKDSCQGDSGGPLDMDGADGCPVQVGIVSWGEGCAEAQAYGVYTRVAAYAGWIRSKTGLPLDTPAAPEASAESITEAQLQEALTQLAGLIGEPNRHVQVGIKGGNTVRLGDRVVFEAASDRPGRLVILDINADREVTPIYPNKFVRTADIGHIEAGGRVEIPGPGYDGFSAFQAVKPTGKGHLVAVLVPEGFDLERVAAEPLLMKKGFAAVKDPESYLVRFVRQIDKLLNPQGRLAVQRAENHPEWAFGMTEYEIAD
jgi:secreted trypsin-like serine protease